MLFSTQTYTFKSLMHLDRDVLFITRKNAQNRQSASAPNRQAIDAHMLEALFHTQTNAEIRHPTTRAPKNLVCLVNAWTPDVAPIGKSYTRNPEGRITKLANIAEKESSFSLLL